MASASDGLATTLSSLPDLSLSPFASTSERKFQLQLLLDNKEKQLQQAGALGQRVLAQQIELEEKIRHLQDSDVERGDDEDLDTDARERYRELADTIKSWDLENAQLSSAFGPKVHIFSPLSLGNLLQVISRSCLRASSEPRGLHAQPLCRPRIYDAHSSRLHLSLLPTRPCRHTLQPVQRTDDASFLCHNVISVIFVSFSPSLSPWLLLVAHFSLSSVLQTIRSLHPSQSKTLLAMNRNAPRLPLLPLPSLVGPKTQLTEQMTLVRPSPSDQIHLLS